MTFWKKEKKTRTSAIDEISETMANIMAASGTKWNFFWASVAMKRKHPTTSEEVERLTTAKRNETNKETKFKKKQNHTSHSAASFRVGPIENEKKKIRKERRTWWMARDDSFRELIERTRKLKNWWQESRGAQETHSLFCIFFNLFFFRDLSPKNLGDERFEII